jgi:hypothetical protein
MELDLRAANPTRCFVISATGSSVHAKERALQKSRSRSYRKGEEFLDSMHPEQKAHIHNVDLLLCCAELMVKL